MAVTRTNVDFAKRILSQRVGNDYVYGGNWSPTDTSVGTDCSGLVIDICDAVHNGPRMAWSRHGMSTESWRPIEVGQTGTIFGTVCVAHPRDFPPDAAVKIAIHHGPGGGANSHTWCEVDGIRGESNGSDGCVTGNQAMSVYDTSYANDWHYIPGPIVGDTPAPQPLSSRDRYAQAIITEGRRRRISERGICIALATALVESNLVMYANAAVPESMNLPHEAVGSDYDSVGLFQQRCPMWGPAAVLMDPTKSAGLFYDQLQRLDYDNPSRSPGWYAQAVQRSAFPDRYDQHYDDAQTLYRRLATTGDDDMASVPQDQWDRVYRELTQRYPSRSPLRHLGEGLVDTEAGMILNSDGNMHVVLVKSLAEIGDPEALRLLGEVAGADLARYPDRADDAALARRILAHIEATNPTVLQQFIDNRKAS
jgi:hypothetical protein